MLSKLVLKIKLIRITFHCSSTDDVKASMIHASDVYAMQGRKGGKVLD